MNLPFLTRWRAGDGARAVAAQVPEAKASRTASLIAFQSAGRPVWSGRDYAALAREGFAKNAIAYRAVRMIAEAAASLPWVLYEGEAELTEHPLLALLARPNRRQANAEFREALVGHLLVSGNAYIEAVALPGAGRTEIRELHVLRPDRMKVVPGADGWPEAYEYSAGGRTVRFSDGGDPGSAAGASGSVPPILHLSLFHPLDDHYGFAPIEAAAVALDIHNAAGAWNKALLDNSARPSGALIYQAKEGGNLSAEQYERLKAELAEGFTGASRAGRPLLLEGGLDWRAMSLTPKDMDFMEAKNAAAREIALAFGIPPMLLGIPGDNTYANYREANAAFWRATVLPMAAKVAGALGAWLAPAFGGEASRLRLWFDADQVEALSGDREALWSRIAAADFLTVDEKRAAVGYGPAEEHELAGKAGFDPNQPRVPRGRGEESGRWADNDSKPLDDDAKQDDPSERTLAQRRIPARTTNINGRTLPVTPGQAARLDISVAQAQNAIARVRTMDPRWQPTPSLYETVEGQIAANLAIVREAKIRMAEIAGPKLPPPSVPLIPLAQPTRTRDVNRYVKEVASWLREMGDAAELGEEYRWLYDYSDPILAALDPPRSLLELIERAMTPTPGYERHHIVEQTPARRARFGEDLIEGRDNVVLIPTLRHWRLTGWFATPTDRFGGLSPRDYLEDKEWRERERIGLEALEIFGIKSP